MLALYLESSEPNSSLKNERRISLRSRCTLKRISELSHCATHHRKSPFSIGSLFSYFISFFSIAPPFPGSFSSLSMSLHATSWTSLLGQKDLRRGVLLWPAFFLSFLSLSFSCHVTNRPVSPFAWTCDQHAYDQPRDQRVDRWSVILFIVSFTRFAFHSLNSLAQAYGYVIAMLWLCFMVRWTSPSILPFCFTSSFHTLYSIVVVTRRFLDEL
jgi:hypothetical protein